MSLKFGYWAPILSGGYVLSNIPQRSEWSIAANIRLAQTAERVGFDYTLLPARFTSLECGDGQNDALATSAYLAAATERLKIIGAFHTAYWHPAMIAKSASTIDVASGGRYSLNILSGWLKDEYRQLNRPWLEHDERYRQSEEFIQILRGLWTSEEPLFLTEITTAFMEPCFARNQFPSLVPRFSKAEIPRRPDGWQELTQIGIF